jgi:hypothetical protein
MPPMMTATVTRASQPMTTRWRLRPSTAPPVL